MRAAPEPDHRPRYGPPARRHDLRATRLLSASPHGRGGDLPGRRTGDPPAHLSAHRGPPKTFFSPLSSCHTATASPTPATRAGPQQPWWPTCFKGRLGGAARRAPHRDRHAAMQHAHTRRWLEVAHPARTNALADGTVHHLYWVPAHRLLRQRRPLEFASCYTSAEPRPALPTAHSHQPQCATGACSPDGRCSKPAEDPTPHARCTTRQCPQHWQRTWWYLRKTRHPTHAARPVGARSTGSACGGTPAEDPSPRPLHDPSVPAAPVAQAEAPADDQHPRPLHDPSVPAALAVVAREGERGAHR